MRSLLRRTMYVLILMAFTLIAQEQEPITTYGHGGFLGLDGKQIPVTLEFVTKAQSYYMSKLTEALPAAKKSQHSAYQKRLMANMDVNAQDRLILEHQSAEWLVANTASSALKLQCAGRLRALRLAMNWKLSSETAVQSNSEKRERHTPANQVIQRLNLPQLRIGNNLLPKTSGINVRSITLNSGQAYINECQAAGVPIPPTINVMDPAGTAGWKSEGFIPVLDQFIGSDPSGSPPVISPAELRSFKTSSPEGMCFALPRFTDATKTEVMLDGVICMGKQSSKVCFWDNQRMGVGFPFPAGTQIPIGVPASAGGLYQAGGKELEGGSGGVCTDCHAGENPYIIHPKSNLAPSGSPTLLWETVIASLPSMPVNRYDPIVAATWPQNKLSQLGSTLPSGSTGCSGCHVKGGAGRFPHLSNQISGYCAAVLTNAINRTMRPTTPPNPHITSAAAGTFRNTWCNFPPNAASEDDGDPHLTTVNQIHYDFQSAGEFSALRNSDPDFELQTRQSPVLTTFTPGANPYTGLASCVSLNTAAAVRVGKRRVTFQTSGSSEQKGGRYELRVDGKVVTGTAAGFDLGGGNRIVNASPGGQAEFQLADGTRLVITPAFWTSQGYWYLHIEVFNTPAREGILGPILTSTDWLPRAPDGSSFGLRPVALLDRHNVLNTKFADAWRVKPSTSLFDYEPGTSTADFTDGNWPSEPGKGCTVTTVKAGPKPPLVREPRPDLAKKACAGIKDKPVFDNCIFDVTVMGDTAAAKAHQMTAKLKAAAAVAAAK